jgi:hypothetical protein
MHCQVRFGCDQSNCEIYGRLARHHTTVVCGSTDGGPTISNISLRSILIIRDTAFWVYSLCVSNSFTPDVDGWTRTTHTLWVYDFIHETACIGERAKIQSR